MTRLLVRLMLLGLLVGVSLKGWEIYYNAQAIRAVERYERYDEAVASFTAYYSALPGDVTDPGSRIPNCNADCTISGNGDGFINGPYSAWDTPIALSGEQEGFWHHLLAAGMIESNRSRHTRLMMMAMPGGSETFVVALVIPPGGYEKPFNGHYYILQPHEGADPATNVTDTTKHSIPALLAAMIDKKGDDGKPFSGDIVTPVYASNGETSCTTDSQYRREETGCTLAIKMKTRQ